MDESGGAVAASLLCALRALAFAAASMFLFLFLVNLRFDVRRYNERIRKGTRKGTRNGLCSAEREGLVA